MQEGQNGAHEAVAAISRKLSQATAESGALNGSRKVEAGLAAAEAVAGSAKWGAQREGLNARKHLLERERAAVAQEGFDELARDLADVAEELAAQVTTWRDAGTDLKGKWAALSERWIGLERSIGGPQIKGRLDVPKFPYALPDGDVARPVPKLVEQPAVEEVEERAA